MLRAENRLWVYVQSGETNFVRRSIAADQPVNGAWFVTNGVSANERVVVTGLDGSVIQGPAKEPLEPLDVTG